MREHWAEQFVEVARGYWTDSRIEDCIGKKELPLMPNHAPVLLRALGLLHKDASMPPKQVRKFRQINHMLLMLRPALLELAERFETVQILDAGCGRSYLTMLIAWWYEHTAKHPVEILGVDRDPGVVDSSRRRAEAANLSSIRFVSANLEEVDLASELPSLSAVLSLHACDTATDDAIVLALKHHAAFVAVAPCCQAELSAQWAEQHKQDPMHPMSGLWSVPHLRRAIAAHVTDNYRHLLLQSCGYESRTSEFVHAHHTPKNTLIRAMKRGNWNAEAYGQYCELRDSWGGRGIQLERRVLELRNQIRPLSTFT